MNNNYYYDSGWVLWWRFDALCTFGLWMTSYLHIMGHMGHVDTIAASDVTASSCAIQRPCCVALVASCPTPGRATKLDASIVKRVPGAEPAMHYCLVKI